MEKRPIPKSTLTNSISETFHFIKKIFRQLIGFFATLAIVPTIACVLLIGFCMIFDFSRNHYTLSIMFAIIALIIAFFVFLIFILSFVIGLGGMAYAIEMFYEGTTPTISQMLKAGIKKISNIFVKVFFIVIIGFLSALPILIYINSFLANFSNYGMSLYNAGSLFIGVLLCLLFIFITVCLAIISPFVVYTSAFRKHSFINTIKFGFKIAFNKLHFLKFIGYSIITGMLVELSFLILLTPVIFVGAIITHFLSTASLVLPTLIFLVCVCLAVLAISFVNIILISSFNLITFRCMENETFITE